MSDGSDVSEQGSVWPAAARAGLVLRVERSGQDPRARLTLLAAVGLVVAAALAVFGIPRVSLHTPIHHMGIMDPACGMTRGVAAMMRGDLGRAWCYNPASPLVIAGGLAVVVRWLVGRFAGLWVNVRLRTTPPTVTLIGAFVVVLEINQQMQVDRLW